MKSPIFLVTFHKFWQVIFLERNNNLVRRSRKTGRGVVVLGGKQNEFIIFYPTDGGKKALLDGCEISKLLTSLMNSRCYPKVPVWIPPSLQTVSMEKEIFMILNSLFLETVVSLVFARLKSFQKRKGEFKSSLKLNNPSLSLRRRFRRSFLGYGKQLLLRPV